MSTVKTVTKSEPNLQLSLLINVEIAQHIRFISFIDFTRDNNGLIILPNPDM